LHAGYQPINPSGQHPVQQKLILASMILALWLIVFLTGKVMPLYSSVTLLLLFVVFYTWLISLAMVHQKRMEIKRPRPAPQNFLPAVSIVISAHNEELVIEETIRALLKLDYPDYEVLVVDDRSTDKTFEILQALSSQLPAGTPYRYYRRADSAFPGKPAALNEALTTTRGDVIAVFDADAFVDPSFLREMVAFLADDNVGAVQARKFIFNWRHNALTRCQHFEYSLDAHFQSGRDSVRGAVELRGNGQLVKREALNEVGGWNNHTLTDDLDLSTRLHIEGWDIRFARNTCVYEEGILCFSQLLKQRRRWTEGTLFRYLEYAGPLLSSKKVSIRTTLDMLAYFLQFMLPLWLALDLIQLGWTILTGDPSPIRILSSLMVVPIFCVCMSIALIVAIIRFNRPPFFKAVIWGGITGFYMTVVWFPLVFGIAVKVLLQKKRRTRWDKTDRSGSNRAEYLDLKHPAK
jgi:1,2-diacylglycerol 3-beta-glucosyltransferase